MSTDVMHDVLTGLAWGSVWGRGLAGLNGEGLNGDHPLKLK